MKEVFAMFRIKTPIEALNEEIIRLSKEKENANADEKHFMERQITAFEEAVRLLTKIDEVQNTH
jgi:hypothetical protein